MSTGIQYLGAIQLLILDMLTAMLLFLTNLSTCVARFTTLTTQTKVLKLDIVTSTRANSIDTCLVQAQRETGIESSI